MISVSEAEQILNSFLLPKQFEQVRLENATGRILAENIQADRDFPPFDRVTMDGIAVHWDHFASGHRIYTVESIVAAGDVRYRMQSDQNCVEIMTGAVLPEGLDTVIRYEDIIVENGEATVLIEDVKRGQNVHKQGSDRLKDDVLIPAGRQLGSSEIAIAATVGKSQLKVSKLPKTAIVTTGDELVPINAIPAPHQIRASNGVMLYSALLDLGLVATLEHLSDDKKAVEDGVKHLLEHYEVLIFIGGSSRGKYDYIPDTLEKNAVIRHFYKIKQRPGKPFWFGTIGLQKFVFALPGNPVSCFLCLEKYFKPWLKNSLGVSVDRVSAVLQKDVLFKPPLTYFTPVRLATVDGVLQANPLLGQGSGDLANLGDADAFMQLPAEEDRFHAGEAYPIVQYRY